MRAARASICSSFRCSVSISLSRSFRSSAKRARRAKRPAMPVRLPRSAESELVEALLLPCCKRTGRAACLEGSVGGFDHLLQMRRLGALDRRGAAAALIHPPMQRLDRRDEVRRAAGGRGGRLGKSRGERLGDPGGTLRAVSPSKRLPCAALQDVIIARRCRFGPERGAVDFFVLSQCGLVCVDGNVVGENAHPELVHRLGRRRGDGEGLAPHDVKRRRIGIPRVRALREDRSLQRRERGIGVAREDLALRLAARGKVSDHLAPRREGSDGLSHAADTREISVAWQDRDVAHQRVDPPGGRHCFCGYTKRVIRRAGCRHRGRCEQGEQSRHLGVGLGRGPGAPLEPQIRQHLEGSRRSAAKRCEIREELAHEHIVNSRARRFGGRSNRRSDRLSRRSAARPRQGSSTRHGERRARPASLAAPRAPGFEGFAVGNRAHRAFARCSWASAWGRSGQRGACRPHRVDHGVCWHFPQ